MRNRTDEGDLHDQIDAPGDHHRSDDGPGDAALGMLRLATQLHRLLESQQGEDDASGADGRQHTVRPRRKEPTDGEVVAVEPVEQEGHRHDQRNGDLPPDDDGVGLAEPSHARRVQRGESEQHECCDELAEGGEPNHARRLGDQRWGVVADVAKRGHRFDRRHADGADPREPPGKESGHPPERVEGEARRSTVDREHRPELRVDKGQDYDQRCTQDPSGDSATPTTDLSRVERREEPSRPDDRSHRHEDKRSSAQGPSGAAMG